MLKPAGRIATFSGSRQSHRTLASGGAGGLEGTRPWSRRLEARNRQRPQRAKRRQYRQRAASARNGRSATRAGVGVPRGRRSAGRWRGTAARRGTRHRRGATRGEGAGVESVPGVCRRRARTPGREVGHRKPDRRGANPKLLSIFFLALLRGAELSTFQIRAGPRPARPGAVRVGGPARPSPFNSNVFAKPDHDHYFAADTALPKRTLGI